MHTKWHNSAAAMHHKVQTHEALLTYKRLCFIFPCSALRVGRRSLQPCLHAVLWRSALQRT